MNDPKGTNPRTGNRADTNWAGPVARLTTANLPAGAPTLNVEGLQLTGPLRGFGRMWQKTFRVRLVGSTVSPAEVITTWKTHFETFWPRGNHFYAPLVGLAPGEVAALSLVMPGSDITMLSTGVMVIYADDESFTLMTPEGHPIAGWITFSAFTDGETTVVQVQSLVRATDPIFELGERLGSHKVNDDFWRQTVAAVARHFAVVEPVEMQEICVDPKVQWGQAKNVWRNSAIRTGLYTMTAPFRALRGRSK
jgi:hypothetical protein